MNKKITLFALFVLGMLGVAMAQVSITNSTPYTQNFDGLPNTGAPTTTNPNPANWYRSAATTTAFNLTVGTGSSNAGGFYSAGAASATDRAFGSLLSSNAKPLYFGVQFVNNTGSAIVSATVSYKCEQWRRGNTNAGLKDTLLFEYSTDADSVYLGNWTNVPALIGSSTNTSTTAAALDGNTVFANVSGNITGLAIPNGAKFWIRFNDYDVFPGSDDMLAVDDFSISFTTGTVAACTEPANSVTNVVATATSTTAIAGSFTGTTPAADGYLVLLDSSATVPAITDATSYTVGQTVGTAVVISNGTSTSFSRSGLAQNTIYHAYVFPYNNAGCTGGPNYKTTDPGNDTAKTLVDACPEPTAPTNLTFTAVGDNNIDGKFNQSVPPADGYVVVYSLSSNIGYPLDSVNYNVGDSINYTSFKSKVADISSSATDTTFSIPGLVSGTKYYVAVIPYNECGGIKNYRRTASNGVNRDDTTTTGTPPLTNCVDPTGVSTNSITLDSTATTITVKFTMPSNADSVMILAAPIAVGFITVRDSVVYPVGSTISSSTATPATVYYRGVDDSVVITGLSPNTVYKVFVATFNNESCLNGPNYSGLATKTVRTAVAVGIKNRQSEAEFSLYPNPTNNGVLFVKFSKVLQEEATLEVIDILGRKLSAQNIANGSEMQTVNVSQFAKGTYLLNIVYKGTNNVSTFIVE